MGTVPRIDVPSDSVAPSFRAGLRPHAQIHPEADSSEQAGFGLPRDPHGYRDIEQSDLAPEAKLALKYIRNLGNWLRAIDTGTTGSIPDVKKANQISIVAYSEKIAHTAAELERAAGSIVGFNITASSSEPGTPFCSIQPVLELSSLQQEMVRPSGTDTASPATIAERYRQAGSQYASVVAFARMAWTTNTPFTEYYNPEQPLLSAEADDGSEVFQQYVCTDPSFQLTDPSGQRWALAFSTHFANGVDQVHLSGSGRILPTRMDVKFVEVSEPAAQEAS